MVWCTTLDHKSGLLIKKDSFSGNGISLDHLSHLTDEHIKVFEIEVFGSYGMAFNNILGIYFKQLCTHNIYHYVRIIGLMIVLYSLTQALTKSITAVSDSALSYVGFEF